MPEDASPARPAVPAAAPFELPADGPWFARDAGAALAAFGTGRKG